MEANIPKQSKSLGIQHKYKKTVLFFPAKGQTCHAYCTYCFRWAQFTKTKKLQFSEKSNEILPNYLKENREVTDVIFTGGDPLIMSASSLKYYIEPLLSSEFCHIQNIRIGTKVCSYWPYRFISDRDTKELLLLFERIIKSGKHLAIQAHYCHPRELQTTPAIKAIQKIRNTGAVIRSQAPIIRGINDKVSIWKELLETQIKLGIIPYYMFVERDTGARHHFEVTLEKALKIAEDVQSQVSGLAKTIRGPVMSCYHGKVLLLGKRNIGGEDIFDMKFLQGRKSEWTKQIFSAKFDKNATWITDLKPAFNQKKFFFDT